MATMIEAHKIGQRAKGFDLGVAVKGGKFQYQEITYNKKGIATIIPKSVFLSVGDALKWDNKK